MNATLLFAVLLVPTAGPTPTEVAKYKAAAAIGWSVAIAAIEPAPAPKPVPPKQPDPAWVDVQNGCPCPCGCAVTGQCTCQSGKAPKTAPSAGIVSERIISVSPPIYSYPSGLRDGNGQIIQLQSAPVYSQPIQAAPVYYPPAPTYAPPPVYYPAPSFVPSYGGACPTGR